MADMLSRNYLLNVPGHNVSQSPERFVQAITTMLPIPTARLMPRIPIEYCTSGWHVRNRNLEEFWKFHPQWQAATIPI